MPKNIEAIENREKCYSCFRPMTSCMCKYINRFYTETLFVILMHPKEFRKTKNGTGHFTHLSLTNSKMFIGIDFTNNKEINNILDDNSLNCYLLYPDNNSVKLNTQTIAKDNKKNVIFIIDSTWPCSRKILALSKNIKNLPKVSFEHTKLSEFKIKTQPNKFCLSTIESTLCILELLNQHKIENIESKYLDSFLLPFYKMVEYQVECSASIKERVPRFLKRDKSYK
ncbi:MAG: tRNA-uridine aminocarboxypropyltransferase [Campylobacterota bacterium]|nr:tRNA-uridine aminocarboxypropyltransferase [Campylobacterota bacterium]